MCAVLVIVASVLALVGWATGVRLFITPHSAWNTIKPNAALGFLLAGGALLVLRNRIASPSQLLAARLLVGLLLLLGAMTLFEDVYHLELGIDGILFQEPAGAAWTPHPGRMAPSLSLSFVLVGLALLLIDTETARGRWPCEVLVAAVLLCAVPRLVGYAYGVVTTGPRPYTVMDAYSSALLVLVATGILAARSGRGVIAILGSPTEGGRMARRLVPAAAILPLLAGALAMIAASLGWLLPPYVAPVTVAGLVIGFGAIALRSGWSASQSDRDREATMQRLQAQHAATRALMESPTVAEAMPRFLSATGETLGWDCAALWQVAHEGGVLRCVHVWSREGVDVDEFKEATLGMRLAPGVELPGLVWMSGQPQWVPNLLRSPSLRGAIATRSGLRAEFGFPIRYGSEIRGVIEFFSSEIRDVDRDLVAMVPVLGTQFGEALERKRAEELLRASEDRFRAVAESATDAVITVDGTAKITYVNPATVRMFRDKDTQLVGAPLATWLPDVTSVTPDLVGSTVERIARRSDGTELPVELSAARWSTEEGVFATLIVRDVSARKEAEAELREARDAAEASNRELEAFSYSVSHDLRAPVRAIDGFSQALLEDVSDRIGDEARENIVRVQTAAKRMSELIDDLLELSQTSRTPLHHQVVDLSTIGREIGESLFAAHPDRTVELVIGDHITAWGDARFLRVVLENLLENAWKFTSQLATSRIELGQLQGQTPTVYYVRDNGVGFNVAFADRLFQPFQRLHDADEFPGTGIGLALVQRVIARHGGRIWAESAVGQGATFYFTLPGAHGA